MSDRGRLGPPSMPTVCRSVRARHPQPPSGGKARSPGPWVRAAPPSSLRCERVGWYKSRLKVGPARVQLRGERWAALRGWPLPSILARAERQEADSVTPARTRRWGTAAHAGRRSHVKGPRPLGPDGGLRHEGSGRGVGEGVCERTLVPATGPARPDAQETGLWSEGGAPEPFLLLLRGRSEVVLAVSRLFRNSCHRWSGECLLQTRSPDACTPAADWAARCPC